MKVRPCGPTKLNQRLEKHRQRHLIDKQTATQNCTDQVKVETRLRSLIEKIRAKTDSVHFVTVMRFLIDVPWRSDRARLLFAPTSLI